MTDTAKTTSAKTSPKTPAVGTKELRRRRNGLLVERTYLPDGLAHDKILSGPAGEIPADIDTENVINE